MAEFYAYVYRDPSRLDRHGQAQAWYVGKGKGDRYKCKWSRGPFFGNYLNAMGCEPEVSRIPVANEAEALELERFLVQEMGRRDLGNGPLVNLTDGGEGVSGYVFSKEVVAKRMPAIAAAQKGRVFSAEHRAKMSVAKRGKPGNRLGTKQPPEAVERSRLANLGRKLSAEHCAKMSAGRKGKKFTEEHKAKIAAAHLGKKASPEARANMSAAHAGKPRKPRSLEARVNIAAAAKLREATRRALKDAANG